MTYTTDEEKKEPIIPVPGLADTQSATDTVTTPPGPAAQGAVAAQPATNAQPAPPATNATTAQAATPAAQPAVQTAATTGTTTRTAATPATQQQLTRQAVSGYGDTGPFLSRLYASRQNMDPYLEQIDEVDRMLLQAVEEYRRTGRNPLADIVLASQKPVRRVDEETRLRNNARLLALNNMISLIGKGIAATGGIRPAPVDNRPIYDIQNRLQRLDDIYRQEGMRYDQNRLLAAIRKDQANLQAAKEEVDALSARRKGYIDLYKDAAENNRLLEEKAAELGINALKYSAEMGYKYDKMKSDETIADKNRAVQYARLAKEHPEVSVLNYKTGQAELLGKEQWARLGGYIARILDQREAAKKGPYGEWIAGKSPLPLNSRITDEELKELQKAATNGEKLTANQLGVITRLFNEMENGEIYEAENSTPFYMPAKPRSMYAQSIRPQYENWLQGMREYYTLTGQIPDNTITVDEARQLFDGMQNVPDKEIKNVLQAAGWQVTE